MTEFSISAPIGDGQISKPEDVLKTRKALNDQNIPAGDLTRPYIDKSLDNGIRQFQRQNNLKEDGYLNPGGETEKTLRAVSNAPPEVESEKLPPVIHQKNYIPNTNIIDKGIPEQGFPNSKVFDPYASPRNPNPDPYFDKKPKNIDPYMQIQQWNKHIKHKQDI